ncbi:MAG: addiction module protein [Flavobacteriales bacterium]|nr:addiction module protein [Flavobacteriales bacterium]
MSTESLKLQLIERLLRTTDEGLLKKVADLFRSDPASSAGGEDEDGLTDEHYNIVKERYEEYKRGEGKSYTWEEVREMARKAKKA